MKQEIVEKAMETKDIFAISMLLGAPSVAQKILKDAHDYLGDCSWILAGLAAIESGHPEQAAAIAISDFFTTLEVLDENKS